MEICMLKEGDGDETEEREFQTSVKDVTVIRRNNGIREVDSCGPGKGALQMGFEMDASSEWADVLIILGWK